MADKIVVLKDGSVEQVGSPHDLYHRPATRFVAGFIGSPRMNFLPCDTKSTVLGQVEISLTEGLTQRLPVEGGSLRPGQPLTLGIRPDDFVAPSGIPGELIVEIEVDFIEHLGNATYLYGTALGENIVALSPSDDFHVGKDNKVSLAVSPADCHLFTADGKALSRLKTPKSWN